MPAPPDYDLLVDRELVGIRWRSPSHAAACSLYPELIAHAQQLDAALFVAIIVGPECPPPDHRARDAFLRGNDRLHPYCEDMRLAVLGDGLRQDVLRSVVTSMSLVARLRGKAFHLDHNLAALLAAISTSLGRDTATTCLQLHTSGLLSAAELAELDPRQAGSAPS